MQLNLFQNIAKGMKSTQVSNFMKEISERLKEMEEELVIDRYEGEIAICENKVTKEKKEIRKEELPKGLKEGSIIRREHGRYVHLEKIEKQTEERIANKMKQIWK